MIKGGSRLTRYEMNRVYPGLSHTCWKTVVGAWIYQNLEFVGWIFDRQNGLQLTINELRVEQDEQMFGATHKFIYFSN